jgi:hypothetical protein
VQVPLELAPHTVAGVHDPHPRLAQVSEVRQSFGSQPLIFKNEACGTDKRLNQLAIVQQPRLVREPCNLDAVLQQHSRAGSEVHYAAFGVDVAAPRQRVREP